MLRKALIAIVAGMCFAGSVTAKVIKSPDYDFRKSGTLKVTEVERTKDATRLTFTAKFKPKGWITLNPTEVEISLPGDTVKVKPIALDAAFNYDEKYFMPESGETVFTVTYPPLPKSVKKIDTGATTNWAIWGIDIAGKGKKADKDARTVTVKPYRPIETIFEADTITVSGFIKGYNRQRSGISVLQLYVEDLAVRNSKPVAIPIKADGSFSRRFLLPMAQTAMMSANVKGISLGVYLEPHNDLEIMIDYDKLLESESTGKGKNDAIRFGGSLGTINNELIASPCSPYIRGWQLDAKMPIDEAKLKIAETYSGIYDTCEKYIAEAKVSEKAAEIMRNTVEVQRLVCMFDYAENRSHVDAIPTDFYNYCITETLKADSAILATGSTILLNRLGFAFILPEQSMGLNVPNLRRAMELCVENGVEFNDDETAAITRMVDFESADSIQNCGFYSARQVILSLQDATGRAGKETELTRIIFNDPQYMIFSTHTETNREYVQRLCGSEELPLIWQFAVSAKEGRNPERFMPAMTSRYGVDNQYLISRVAEAAKPKNGAWKLPDNEAGNFLSALVAPYKGKYLLVDFWDLHCGPCRAGIEGNKERREYHRGNPGFGFLFIASEAGSPIDGYNAYVEKNLKGENVVRLPEDKMILLRELFEFNGIPRYILFNPDGEVVSSNYSIHQFWQLLTDEGIIAD